MIKIITILFLIISNTYASQVSSGQVIKASDFNSSTSHIGEIKSSLLEESEFQSLYGTCWVKMRGQSITNSDLANLTNNRLSTLPDSAGRFLRDIGGNASALGSTQEDENKEHWHYLLTNEETSGFNLSTDGHLRRARTTDGDNSYALTTDTGSSVPSKVRSGNSGGIETRPSNLSVNYFIKINKVCN